MLRRLLLTDTSTGPVVLRVALGVVMLAHGIGKLFPVPGLAGQGFSATVAAFEGLGAPTVFAVAGTLAEAAAGALLIPGLLARVAGGLVVAQMAVAAWLSGALSGFYLPGGFEYNFALAAMGATLCVTGAGRLSVDAWLARPRTIRVSGDGSAVNGGDLAERPPIRRVRHL